MKVMVIEDEDDIREIICEFLLILDVQYSEAANAKEACEILRNEKFDVIITDLKLSDISGIEIIKKVREIDKNTFIVACSGFSDEEAKAEALNAGAEYYIEKPFSFKEISAVLDMAKKEKK